MSQTDDNKRLQHLEAGMADAHDEKSVPVEEPRRKYGICALPAPVRHAVFFLLGIGAIMSVVCCSGAAAEAAVTGNNMWYGQGEPSHPNDIAAPPSEVGDVFVLEEVIEVLKDGAPSKANRVAELQRRQDNGNGNTTPTATVPGDDTTTAAEPTTETTTVVATSSEVPETTLTTTDPPAPDTTTTTSEPPTSTLTSTIVEDPTSTVEDSTTTVIPTSDPSSSSESPDESETTSEPDTTREAPTTSAITGTITSVLPDGRTTTITSTSVVDVDPTAEATQDPSDDPDLQNASPRLASGNMIALTVAMVAGVVLIS